MALLVANKEIQVPIAIRIMPFRACHLAHINASKLIGGYPIECGYEKTAIVNQQSQCAVTSPHQYILEPITIPVGQGG